MNGTLKSWLLEGDPAIRYHAMKLLFEDEQGANVERHRTETHGWGKKLLDLQDKTTHQWTGIYSPKWISTHYTLMELKNLGICPMCASFVKGVEVVVKALWPNKGRVNKYRHQDMCVVGMLVSLMTYAQLNSPELEEMVDY
ncbi:MAG: hypothetical protein IH571_00390, partial [Acholeplasmataceae bacterium]|nr:hypothetical protein [Acholeplasmataceae bacterium]